MPRRFSCGRHRFEGSASADRPATARAMARRAAGEALDIIPMSVTSHSCRNTRCKKVNLTLAQPYLLSKCRHCEDVLDNALIQ